MRIEIINIIQFTYFVVGYRRNLSIQTKFMKPILLQGAECTVLLFFFIIKVHLRVYSIFKIIKTLKLKNIAYSIVFIYVYSRLISLTLNGLGAKVTPSYERVSG